MSTSGPTGYYMRIFHRYLGFFLAGIMAVYSLSGIVMIFRNGDTFKKTTFHKETIAVNLSSEEVGRAIKVRNLKFDKEEGNLAFFKDGQYERTTGEIEYVTKELPYLLDKMTHMHKATTGDPLFFMNIFFGLSLLFFVISSFWMFIPSSNIFKKGLYFTLGGIILTLIMVFI
jgi:hypothetical protein